jgi:transcriptional regulator with PAS, ATPase and Fis domain
VARAIHAQGHRQKQPFVSINCGALPEALLESELFGHVKGAFTGADRDKPGLFMVACGGTLFLDELAELPLALQVKLLRVLTEREVRPVGATRQVAIDVRLVAATNRNLRELVQEGRFREDLFYRLSVVEVTLPALRDRRDDILAIAESILAKHAEAQKQAPKRLSADALRELLAYSFPGNVRELQNILLRASVLCDGPVIQASDLALPSMQPARSAQRVRSRADFADVEREQLLSALAQERWNVSRVARKLGIPRNTLYRKLSRLGIAPAASRT